MAYICIYDNVPDAGGYRIHARSAEFPYGYERDILAVSEYFNAGTGDAESVAIRYAPLKNDAYLFSWILRHPVVYVEGQRAWHTVVHFLMDETEADALFRHPISGIVQWVDETARQIYRDGHYDLPDKLRLHSGREWPTGDMESNAEIDDKILMAGVSYCKEGKVKNQLFLASKDPCGEMDWIQKWTPYALRKRLSFCLGLENKQESTGVVFNFPLRMSLSQLRTASSEGAPVTEKYWYGDRFMNTVLLDNCDRILSNLYEYPWLADLVFKCVPEWEELALLANDDLSRGLSKLIIETGVDNWVDLLDSRKMSRIELEQLAALLGRQRELKPLRNAIGRRLKRSQRGRYAQSRNAYDAVGEHPNGAQNHIQRPYGNDRDNAEVHKILLNHVLNAAAVVALVVVAIALITLARQTLMAGEIEVEQVVYYCISREAAADVLKLCGAFVCGFLAAVAGKRLLSRLE